MASYGESIRKIRQGKACSATDLYEGLAAPSFAQRFEQGEVTVQYETFRELLARLNVSESEFQYIHHGYQLQPPEGLWAEFNQAASAKNTQQLARLAEREKHSALSFNRVLASLAQLVLKVTEHGQVSLQAELTQAEHLFLTNYFSNKDFWTLNEIQLFTNFHHFFSRPEQAVMMKQCFLGLRQYATFPNYLNLMTALLSNYILACYEAGDYQEGHHWYVKLQSLPKDKNFIYANLRRDICGSYYYYIKGDYRLAQNLLDNACLVLSLLGYEREASTYRRNLKRFKGRFERT